MGGVLFSGNLGAAQFIDEGITVPILVVPTYGRSRAVPILAQLDTGSTESSIDVGLATLLRLRRAGSAPVAGFAGTTMAPLYAAGLQMAGGAVLTPGPVLGARLADTRLRNLDQVAQATQQGMVLALIGREAMVSMVIELDGPRGTWTATAAS